MNSECEENKVLLCSIYTSYSSVPLDDDPGVFLTMLLLHMCQIFSIPTPSLNSEINLVKVDEFSCSDENCDKNGTGIGWKSDNLSCERFLFLYSTEELV